VGDFGRGVESFDYFGVGLNYKPEHRETTKWTRPKYHTWSFPIVVTYALYKKSVSVIIGNITGIVFVCH